MPEPQPLYLADSYDVAVWFWVPEECAARERTNRITYRSWIGRTISRPPRGT